MMTETDHWEGGGHRPKVPLVPLLEFCSPGSNQFSVMFSYMTPIRIQTFYQKAACSHDAELGQALTPGMGQPWVYVLVRGKGAGEQHCRRDHGVVVGGTLNLSRLSDPPHLGPPMRMTCVRHTTTSNANAEKQETHGL